MDDSYTIQISSNLVNQLAKDWDQPKKKTRKLKTKVPKEPPHQQQITMTPAPSLSKSNTGGGWPLQPPMFLPATLPPAPTNPEVEAIQSVLRESERVVKRLEKQEANRTQELTQRAKELRDKEFKLPYQKPMPCGSEKESCLECYKKHGKEPLKCAQAVKAFADCARQARLHDT